MVPFSDISISNCGTLKMMVKVTTYNAIFAIFRRSSMFTSRVIEPRNGQPADITCFLFVRDEL